MSDLLASATLAKLYIEQGHFARAREVVDAVLEKDPFHGAACAWRQRLRTRTHAGVNVRLEDGQLAVKWRRVPGARLASLEIHVFGAGSPTAEVTRSICERANGTFPLPRPRHGSAVACIRSAPGPDAPILAVSPHVTW